MSEQAYAKAFEEVLVVERGYSDHQADLGGKTRFGITEAVARANGYFGPMNKLPLSKAKEIYRTQYWNVLKLNDVCRVDERIAHEMFDTGVNQGVTWAAKFLQRSLNALNRRQKDYPDISCDGVMGPMSVYTLQLYAAKRKNEGVIVLLKALNCLQGARYIEISDVREQNEDFTYGWIRTRIKL